MRDSDGISIMLSFMIYEFGALSLKLKQNILSIHDITIPKIPSSSLINIDQLTSKFSHLYLNEN